MADQGLWWKLWCAALDDPDLDNLEVADFGRYCKLGAFVKRHGQAGEIALAPPSRGLCTMLQVADFRALMDCIGRLPNVVVRRADTKCFNGVSTETDATVTFTNWQRYQGDYSTFRVRNKRARETEMKRLKRRRDEKRGEVDEKRREETRVTPTTTPLAADAAPTNPAWGGYSAAYHRRYSEAPVRNAKVNGQLAQLIKRIPADEAPSVAAFYVEHNAAFYVRAGHSVDLLLRDAEKLRTEWATGQRITETGARQGDQRQERGSVAGRLLDKAERQRQGELDAQP